ncbi:hypothetical protein SAMN05443245_3579 [Paraburkholderia fungorum]|uniref:Uncharacterized protein n=1 Tax=Paraburkholderia fungorum TaxID=134537 RepID=A0A1H1H6C0_9BURK|nr:hypothetical protein SAMN05443245_3579 [Paraburkholderia fungorum]
MQNEEYPQATESDSNFQKSNFMERRQTNQFCYFHQGLYSGQVQVGELSLSVFQPDTQAPANLAPQLKLGRNASRI